MKWIYYIVVLFCLVGIGYLLFSFNLAVAKEVKGVSVFYHKHEIHRNFKKIENQEVQLLFDEEVTRIKNDFLRQIENVTVQEDISYSLYLSNDVFYEEHYISVVLFSETYLGGAHPNHDIFTIVYDTEKEQIILANNFSLVSIAQAVREYFFFHPKVVDTLWMMEGTKPLIQNYKHFVFTEKGVLFYFLPYQIAPYSSGTLKVFIPNERIGLS